MNENILVAVAWPYANSQIHVGNITGSYLPADIFARFNRLKGNRVIMVSGSDSHGTPVTVRADADGSPPEQVYKQFHASFLELFQKLGLSYDLFTSTHTQNHFKVSQAIFLALQKSGYLYTDRQQQWFAPSQGRFLPDRYLEGTCYMCGFQNARGDQCDNCGNLLDASLLIDPRSKIDGTSPELRDTEHFFLDLGMKTVAALLGAALALPVLAAPTGEDVEVTAGVVTGLKCALAARSSGGLKALTSCPHAEAARELVVFDVAERRIFRIGEKKVFRYQLESAFGGGSIDFEGKTVKVDEVNDIATVEVAEFSVTKKPKAGALKGCL